MVPEAVPRHNSYCSLYTAFYVTTVISSVKLVYFDIWTYNTVWNSFIRQFHVDIRFIYTKHFSSFTRHQQPSFKLFLNCHMKSTFWYFFCNGFRGMTKTVNLTYHSEVIAKKFKKLCTNKRFHVKHVANSEIVWK